MKLIISAKYNSESLLNVDICSFECDFCGCDGFSIDF